MQYFVLPVDKRQNFQSEISRDQLWIKGKTPDEIKEMKREDLEKPVTLEDFDDAILRCQKSVGNMDLSKYERWIKEYGSY